MSNNNEIENKPNVLGFRFNLFGKRVNINLFKLNIIGIRFNLFGKRVNINPFKLNRFQDKQNYNQDINTNRQNKNYEQKNN